MRFNYVKQKPIRHAISKTKKFKIIWHGVSPFGGTADHRLISRTRVRTPNLETIKSFQIPAPDEGVMGEIEQSNTLPSMFCGRLKNVDWKERGDERVREKLCL